MFSSSSDKQWLKIGQVGRAYGIKGWVRIFAYTDSYTQILHYNPWYLFLNGEWQEVTKTSCKPHGKTLIAHFAGVDTPEQAKLYVGASIATTRDQLPSLSPEEYYWADLYGLTVYNLKREYLGEIVTLFETGANDVLVVKKDLKEQLIPYVRQQVVKSIDLIKKEMWVDWETEV